MADLPSFEQIVDAIGALIEGGFCGPIETLATTNCEGLIVDTSCTVDEGWETAILDRNGSWPVERYVTREAAAEGHQRWCALAGDDLMCITSLGPSRAPGLFVEHVTLQPLST